jgi:membrane associated rhomboid family serine protease
VIVIANAIVFLAIALTGESGGRIAKQLVLRPSDVLNGFVWQPFTYMWLHADFWHIFGNMLALYFFGPEVERLWGTRKFVRFYLACGAGAAAFIVPFNIIYEGGMVGTVGASAAVYGVLMAFAYYFPNRLVLLMFVIPIKVKYLAWAYIILTLVLLRDTMTNPGLGGNISHIGHLGGIAIAGTYLYLWPYVRRSFPGAFRRGPRLKMWRPPKARGSREEGVQPYLEPTSDDLKIRARMDELLDKVNEKGIDSLTPKEREFLEEVSERYRKQE